MKKLDPEKERQLRVDGCIHEYKKKYDFEICTKCFRSRVYLEDYLIYQVLRRLDRR